MLVFVALVLNRFDIKLATEIPQRKAFPGPQKFLELDISNPALGFNGPIGGSDVYVNLGDLET